MLQLINICYKFFQSIQDSNIFCLQIIFIWKHKLTEKHFMLKPKKSFSLKRRRSKQGLSLFTSLCKRYVCLQYVQQLFSFLFRWELEHFQPTFNIFSTLSFQNSTFRIQLSFHLLFYNILY